MEGAGRRIQTIASHFDTSKQPPRTGPFGPGAPIDFDVDAVTALLDHDNLNTRKKMKELMRDPLFIP